MGEARKTSLKETMTWLADTFRMFMGSTEKMTLSDMAANVGQVYNVGREAGVIEGESSGWARGLTEGIELGKEEGKQAEYDRFWDTLQDNGNRTDYKMAFSFGGWTAENFDPKYGFTPSDAYYMFRNSSIRASLIDILAKRNLSFDTSNCTNLGYAFYTSVFTELPIIDMTQCEGTTANYIFADNQYLKKVSIKVAPNTFTAYTGWFRSNSALEDLEIIGTLDNSLDLGTCPKLNRNSFGSVFNAMSTTVTGQTLTVSRTAVNAAFTEEEWSNLTATKPNWTYVYRT